MKQRLDYDYSIKAARMIYKAYGDGEMWTIHQLEMLLELRNEAYNLVFAKRSELIDSLRRNTCNLFMLLLFSIAPIMQYVNQFNYPIETRSELYWGWEFHLPTPQSPLRCGISISINLQELYNRFGSISESAIKTASDEISRRVPESLLFRSFAISNCQHFKVSPFFVSSYLHFESWYSSSCSSFPLWPMHPSHSDLRSEIYNGQRHAAVN